MSNEGTGAEKLIWLAGRQSGRPDSSLPAADDILAALTARIAELEARVSAVLADLDPALPPAAELTRASEERHMLANEMRLLREAIQESRGAQPPARPVANSAAAQVNPSDPVAAVANEMRSLLTELLADFRSRPVAPPAPVAAVPAPIAALPPVAAPLPVELTSVQAAMTAEIVESPAEEFRDALVEDVEVVAPPVDLTTEIASPPIDRVESIVEHVDELIKPAARDEFVEYDEFVDDLPMPEPVGQFDVLPIVESTPEPAATIEEIEVTVAPAEPAPPIVDEPVFEAAEPAAPILDERLEAIRWTQPPLPIETIELVSTPVEPAEPVVEDVEEILQPEVMPPVESFEVMPAPTKPVDAVVDENVEDFHQPEPIVDEYVAPAPDVTITPPAPQSVPDPRIEALWETAEVSPPVVPEEFVAEARPAEIYEPPAPFVDVTPQPPLEFAPEPPVVFTPEPPIVFVPEPPLQFVVEPPLVFEPEPQAPTEPLIAPPAPDATYVPVFPELRVSADEGLHEIQVVISPIHSFPRLLETERRIRALSTVNALHLRDFRNGVATLTVSVGEAISPAEFGAVIQMLEDLHLRLEGTTLSSVELRAEDNSPTR